MIIPKISNQTKYSEKESSFNPLIPDCHPSNNIKSADIAVVGDFPNDVEIVKQELFTGPAGSQFNRICAACRLARYQIYMTTACKTKPPGGNSDKLWTVKGWRHPDWGKLQQDLIDEMLEDNIPESEALEDENVESIQSIIDLIWWVYLR